MPLRDWRKKAPDGSRIAVWVPSEISKWKHDTEISWGDIMRAGVEALSKGSATTSRSIFKRGSVQEITHRLDFFVKKTIELQKEVEKLNKHEGDHVKA